MSDRRALVDALFPHFRASWVVLQDADLVAIDKPHYLSTHAPEEGRTDDARSRLAAFLASAAEPAPYLGIHQRLDKGTSGVLVFSRSKRANPSLARQFEGREVEKSYVAVVSGRLAQRGVLEHRLAPGDGGLMEVVPRGGQLAVTRYEVLDRKKHRMLVRAMPETGRTHQVRVQLAAAGAPIAGDARYGGAAATRLLLHAAELRLAHPVTHARLTLTADVPPLFRAWLAGEPAPDFQRDTLEAAMRAAADARYGVARDDATTALRLVNGAGDGLPGVALDLYGEHLVLHVGEELDEGARKAALDAAHALGARGVYVKIRPKHASVVVDTRRDAYAPKHASRGESAPEVFTILEHGVPLEVRLGDGLSTGLFLDQRENRRRVRELAGGARVANLFAYTGAFTAAAVVGGARASATVDVSKTVLAWARRNLDAIGADAAAHVTVELDALAFLAREKKRGARYDLVVLDPPSFATTKTSTFAAASDYAALAALAFAVVAPGGRLVACTNHRGIPRVKLRRKLHEAAREAGVEIAQMKDLPDPIDFPPEPGAEAHLKAVLVTLARQGAAGEMRRSAPAKRRMR